MDRIQGIAGTDLNVHQAVARFMSGVYRWMLVGVLLTACISAYIGTNPQIAYALAANKLLFYGLIIAQFAAVVYLSARIMKMSASTATFIFLLYAALTGTTLSVIFLAYTQEGIQSAFFLSAFSFAGLSAFGYVTKRDLGPVGTFCHMGLWGLIGTSILAIFFPSLMGGSMSLVFGMVGVLVFAGLAAYDTQKIKSLYAMGREGSEEQHKGTIMGALTLYLDFINLFLMILRFTGGRRRN
jgi:uncharacterized protein